jgi:hypothetical protein
VAQFVADGVTEVGNPVQPIGVKRAGRGLRELHGYLGCLDVVQGLLAVHDDDAPGLLNPPFQFRLELLPQFNGIEVTGGIDVAEVVGGQRAQLAPQVDTGDLGDGPGAPGHDVGGLGLCLWRR